MASSLSSKVSKTLSTKTSTPPFPTFRAAKTAILAETNPEKLAHLFTQCSLFPTFARHRPIFHLTACKLARSGRIDLIDNIIQSQTRSSPLLKSEGFWIRLMMLYSNAGMVDRALNVFNDVTEKKYCDVSEKSVSALLSGFLKNGEFGKVYEVFEEMPKRVGVKPGVVSCSLVLKAFVKEGKLGSARDWVRKMEKEWEVMPGIECFNVLLGGCLEKRDWKEFDGVVNEIAKKGMAGNVSTYNYRVSRLCKEKECARARKLLDEMVSKGLKPNSVSYNTVIDGFCRIGDFESANKVLEKMIKDGHVKPCSFTYFTMIRSLVNEGEFDSALAVSKEIIKRKWVPPFEAMEGLVKGLLKDSRVDDAKEIVNEMKKKLKGPAVESWRKVEAALPV